MLYLWQEDNDQKLMDMQVAFEFSNAFRSLWEKCRSGGFKLLNIRCLLAALFFEDTVSSRMLDSHHLRFSHFNDEKFTERREPVQALFEIPVWYTVYEIYSEAEKVAVSLGHEEVGSDHVLFLLTKRYKGPFTHAMKKVYAEQTTREALDIFAQVIRDAYSRDPRYKHLSGGKQAKFTKLARNIRKKACRYSELLGSLIKYLNDPRYPFIPKLPPEEAVKGSYWRHRFWKHGYDEGSGPKEAEIPLLIK